MSWKRRHWPFYVPSLLVSFFVLREPHWEVLTAETANGNLILLIHSHVAPLPKLNTCSVPGCSRHRELEAKKTQLLPSHVPVHGTGEQLGTQDSVSRF